MACRRQPRVRPRRASGRDRDLDRLPRRRLRQRGCRDVLRHAQEGARQSPQLAVAARTPVGGVRVHRGVLQPPTPPLHAEHALARQLRATPALAARCLRTITRTTKINYLPTPCRANRGRSKVSARVPSSRGSRSQAGSEAPMGTSACVANEQCTGTEIYPWISRSSARTLSTYIFTSSTTASTSTMHS
jgi:hypothetical protein